MARCIHPTTWNRAVVAAVAVVCCLATAGLSAGCFNPSYREDIACDQGACPPGYRCESDVCRPVGHPSDAGSADAPDDTPDAAPVACSTDDQCKNPTDPCLLAGPCEDGVCKYQPFDCSALDGECVVGVCTAGQCQAESAREGLVCGAGIEVCGDYGDCEYGDDCQPGIKVRSCTDSVCLGGKCDVGAPYDDTLEDDPACQNPSNQPCVRSNGEPGVCTGLGGMTCEDPV